MERGGEEIVFLDKSGLAGMLREDGDAGTDAFNYGAANENHFERILFQRAGAEEDVAGELAAITIAEDDHIEKVEGGLHRILYMSGEENCAGTSAEDGFAIVSEFANGVVEAFFLKELQLRGAFAAGKDQAVAGFEVVDGTNFNGIRAKRLHSDGVGFEVTLHSEDADFHGSFSPNIPGERNDIGVMRAAWPHRFA